MKRHIARALVGTLVAALFLTAFGTFILARLATRNQELRRLEATTARTNELFVSLDAALLRNPGQARAARNTTTVTQFRRELLSALTVSGIGIGFLGPGGRFLGDLPSGVRAADLDAPALLDGGTISGQRGNTLWAADGATVQRPNGRTLTAVTVLTVPRERLFGTTFRWFAGSAVASLVIAVAVSLWLAQRLAAPLQEAVATTTRMAQGDLGARLVEEPGSNDELAVLARSINAMGDALARAKDQERQFLLSVSHDLRTPLTSIRGYAEAIADGAVDDPGSAAGIIIGEAGRLERLVGDLLDLARLDVDHFELHPVGADVVDVVSGVLQSLHPEATAARVSLVDRSAGAMPIRATIDIDRVSQVVVNLVTNALSFASTTVWATTERDGDEVVIQVGDDGPGIPAPQLPHVFDRLYQADNQPARRGRGSGLGLAIVAELCTRMGGGCAVRSVEGHGTTFRVRLPLGVREAGPSPVAGSPY